MLQIPIITEIIKELIEDVIICNVLVQLHNYRVSDLNNEYF